jgi:PAS domain S-box-containing protein
MTVGYVEGTDAPSVDHEGVRFRAVEADAASDGWRSVDCAVLTGTDGVETLAAMGDLPVPVLLYDPDDDPAVAARATRSGVDEYVPAAALDEERLADRIAAVAGGRRDGEREDAALRALLAVATDGSLDRDEKMGRLLEVGRERLGLEVGSLSRVDGDSFTVEAVSGDHPELQVGETAPLSATRCRQVVESEELLDLHDVEAAVPEADPDGGPWSLGCYIGGPVVVDDEVYGTLCFASDSPRESFTAGERAFVELLVAWASYEIERDRRERSLRRYRAVHETVEGMVFVVGREARLELATQPLADRFGYDRDDLIGRPLTDLLGGDVVQEGYEALEALQSGADSVSIEVTAATADGETVPIAVELSLLSSETEFEGMVGVVYDRSELTETRAELAAQRDRFQNLFDRVPDPVVDVEFVDGEPVFRAVNAAFEAAFGDDADEVVGRPATDLGPAGEDGWFHELEPAAIRAGDGARELRRETAEGRRTFLFRGFPYPDEGADRAFGIYTDVTEQLEQERRLRVLHRVLRHNLRNEMNAIMGYADLLSAADGDADEGHAEKIHEKAAGVAELGDQVRWIEQALDRDREPSAVDPAAVVADAVADHREAYPETTVRVDDAESVPVVADELLELAVGNLLENAVEHGSSTVEVEIAPSDEDPAAWVDVAVRDDGPGLPERERAVVGGDREITQMDHSRGLGLWVTRWVLEGAGGRLVFGDQSGGGSVVLRLRRADADR